jgi:hypothetical protein
VKPYENSEQEVLLGKMGSNQTNDQTGQTTVWHTSSGYASDLTDEQWTIIRPMPSWGAGRPLKFELRRTHIC